MHAVSCPTQVLASYINPGDHTPKLLEPVAVPPGDCPDPSPAAGVEQDGGRDTSCLPGLLAELLSQSCLVPAISSYLRNDSGTYWIHAGGTVDMGISRHLGKDSDLNTGMA